MIINQSAMFFTTNQSASEFANKQVKQEQAWLQSLERAGLSDALKQFRVIESLTIDVPPESLTEHANDAKWRKNGGQVEFGSKGSVETALSSRRSESTFRSGNINSQEVPPENRSDGPVQVMLGSRMSLVDNSSLSVLKPATLTRSASSLALNSLQYPSQNISVLRTNVGVEVWIRDAGISKPKLVDILKGLRQSMGALGVSLSRVVLNGRDVSFSQQTREIDSRSGEV